MAVTLTDQDKLTLRTAVWGAVWLMSAAGAAGSAHKVAAEGSIALTSATGLVGHVLAEAPKGMSLPGLRSRISRVCHSVGVSRRPPEMVLPARSTVCSPTWMLVTSRTVPPTTDGGLENRVGRYRTPAVPSSSSGNGQFT
ncbi:hypothetical protein [Nonomuraea rubra]|uniref:hypothetical protein n=1 Tax=Nonomuraea rubra TaxID=46180 RepID=UPI0033E8398B